MPLTSEELYAMHCGSCHLQPEPGQIPRKIWAEGVLPEMAARLGVSHLEYSPYAGVSMDEALRMQLTGSYPQEALLDSTEWQRLYDYVLEQAPDTIAADPVRSTRHKPLQQFRPRAIEIDSFPQAAITGLDWDEEEQVLRIGDGYGFTRRWRADGAVNRSITSPRFRAPATSQIRTGERLLQTEIGIMNPSEDPRGNLYWREGDGTQDTLQTKLHRPVYTITEDLDQDGADEILVAEFGNLTGQLTLLLPEEEYSRKHPLLELPGVVKMEITDLDGDGRKDILAMTTQGREGIVALYQKDDLQFRSEWLLQWPPEYGTSWFELADFNDDGLPDLATVHGDNADYSNFLKPFHGLRIHLNDGQNNFTEAWFYPLYGATQLVAEDFDRDGDVDLGVTCYFPDFARSLSESFVYFENEEGGAAGAIPKFATYATPEAGTGRWLVTERGDFDGDVDMMLGNYYLPVGATLRPYVSHWLKNGVDLLLLENTLR